MEHYLILARSITYAQRMQRVCHKSGIYCDIFRAPRDLTDLGCAYVLSVSAYDIVKALRLIQQEHLNPIKVFFYQDGYYQEVPHDLF